MQAGSSSIYKHYISSQGYISQQSGYATNSIIMPSPNKHTELLSPALSAGSLVSVGCSSVCPVADSEGSTTVAIGTGTVLELPGTVVELMTAVEFDRAISIPEGLKRTV